MQYFCGRNNVVADCLSRPIKAIQVDVFDLAAIAEAQANDSEINDFKGNLNQFTLPSSNVKIFCNMSTMCPRPFVPGSLRRSVIESLHKLTHPGVKVTTKIV